MSRYETRSSQFGLVSGIRQPSSDMVLVAEPAGLFAPEARKGQLYIITEADQDVARGRDACQLVSRTIRKLFYEDSSYSVTSSLRKAISAANKALYQQNFNVMAQKRAFVGVTCAVVKGNDLYIAQVNPTQAYVLAEGKLRALPTNLVWNPAQASPTPFLKPGAIGTSLSIEPVFYRAVLRPGDALLLCSSNLSRLLGRDQVMQLLRAPDPSDMMEGLLALCKQNSLPEAHGIAVGVYTLLSPAAQAAPLSRAGISERGLVAMRATKDWAGRLTGEAALLLKGPYERARRRKAAARREQERAEEERLAKLPEEPLHSPNPLPVPRPLDLGESLDERIEQARQARNSPLGSLRTRPVDTEVLPPSTFMGEGNHIPVKAPERRVDLSDTPGMAAFGRKARSSDDGLPSIDPTVGERLRQPFVRIGNAVTNMGRRRRLRRPPPSAMPQMRRQQGLSYRRQRPPFPWKQLLLLIMAVALLIVYGTKLSSDYAQRQANDVLRQAEEVVFSVRKAPDNAVAQERLDLATAALAQLKSTNVVTSTTENRQRYEAMIREYEWALASVQKLTYFDDLTVIAEHPIGGGLFDRLVIPPPPQEITNTVAFESIYVLDSNAGALYRMPREGGQLQQFLQPGEIVDGLQVGKAKAHMWRIDNVVTVAQSDEGGGFIYYFRAGDRWMFSNLAGSEEWGRTVDKQFRVVSYEGNLYIWGAAPGQVLKYFSGRFGEFPDAWIKNDGGKRVDGSVDLAVDGRVYLLQPNGSILVFNANAFEREIPAPPVTPPLVASTSFFVSSDPDGGSIFLVDTNNERIIQLDKQTGELIQQIRARLDSPIRLDQLISISIDESAVRPTLYIVNGGQILRATLPERPPAFGEGADAPGGPVEPTPEPTPAP